MIDIYILYVIYNIYISFIYFYINKGGIIYIYNEIAPPHNPLSPLLWSLELGINTCVHMCFSIVPSQSLRGKGVKRREGIKKTQDVKHAKSETKFCFYCPQLIDNDSSPPPTKAIFTRGL